jgi:tripartite-type tricarboxylate transporter receptor subunit TctC
VPSKRGTTRREALRVCASAAAVPLLGMVAAAAAETDYPARPVRVIVPYPAGGGADTVSRILFVKLSDGLGQQFVIENRGGAGGTIGAAVAARPSETGIPFSTMRPRFPLTRPFTRDCRMTL